MVARVPVAATDPLVESVAAGPAIVPPNTSRARAPEAALYAFKRYVSDDWASSIDAQSGKWLALPDASALAEARSLAKALALDESDHGLPGLGVVESEHYRKFTVEDGAPRGWWAAPEGMGQGGDHADCSAAFKTVSDWLGEGKAEAVPSSYPLHTNCGLPMVTSDPLAKVWSALIVAEAGGSPIRVFDVLEKYRADGADSRPAIMLFTRTKSTDKLLPEYVKSGGGLKHVANVKGMCAGARQVFGVPSAVNMALQPGANGMKKILFTSAFVSHHGPAEVAHKLATLRQRVAVSTGDRDIAVLEDDISGFDQSVSSEHQRALAAQVYSLRLSPDWVEGWKMCNRLPVYTPPIQDGWEATAFERPVGGMTTSGMITTTIDGTLINVARIMHCVMRIMGYASTDEALARLKRYEWAFLAFGDDTLVILPRRYLDADAWRDASAEFGFRCKIREGATFLMKFSTPDGHWMPVTSRIFQRTVGGERPPSDPAPWLAGLLVRSTGVNRNPRAPDLARALNRLPLPLGLRINPLDFEGSMQAFCAKVGLEQLLRQWNDAKPDEARDWRRDMRRIADTLALPDYIRAQLGGDGEYEWAETRPDPALARRLFDLLTDRSGDRNAELRSVRKTMFPE